jgi:hypothetical protein
MLDNLSTLNLGVIFKKSADRLVNLGQIILIPSSVSLWNKGVVGSCHRDRQEGV